MTAKNAGEIRDWLASQIAELTGAPADEIDTAATFDSFGLASRDAVSLSGDIEDWLGRRLSATILYEHPTIDALAHYLAGLDQRATDAVSSATQREPQAEALSDEEAEAALLAKLTQLDGG